MNLPARTDRARRWPPDIGRVLLLAVTALTGCGPRPLPPPLYLTGPATHQRTILLDNGFVEIRIEAPDVPAGPKPAVVSFVEEFRTPLLERGIVVVNVTVHWESLRGLAQSPPPVADGPPPEPAGKWLLASPSAQVIGQGYLGLIEANANGVIPRVLDTIATDPDIDPARLGIVGFSTNGFTALLATARSPRLRVAVALGASGDFRCFLHESTLAMDGKPLDLDPTYDRNLREIDPLRHPFRLVHAAVLMVNGRDDLPVPLRCAERTARALRRAYKRVGSRERFRFVVIDRGHTMGPEAHREALAWLERWL